MANKQQYLVLHCTATPEGREVTSDDIRHWHTAPVAKGGRGWKQVGYRRMIHLDGTVEELVANNDDGIVDPWEITNGVAGKNSISQHWVYSGGVALDGKTPKDTRTQAQKDTLEKLVKDFHCRFPDVKIVGHNHFGAKACPSFDVQAWLKEIGIFQTL
ncbi:MAG: hypothetical protein RL662_2118 [Bacteroidota bacterium]|jgi:hypothetical protein